MKTFSVLIVIMLMPTIFSCAKQRTSYNIICEGTIYDTIGGAGVAGIYVTLSACEPKDGRDMCTTFAVGQATTDGSGHYYINEKGATSGRYFIAGKGITFRKLQEKELRNNYYTNGYLK